MLGPAKRSSSPDRALAKRHRSRFPARPRAKYFPERTSPDACPPSISCLWLSLQRSEIGVEILDLRLRHSQSQLGAPPNDVGSAHRPFVVSQIEDLDFGQVGAERPTEIRLRPRPAQ